MCHFEIFNMRSSREAGKAVAPHTIARAIGIEDGSNAFFIQTVGFGLRVVCTGGQTDFHTRYAQELAVGDAEPVALFHIGFHPQSCRMGGKVFKTKQTDDVWIKELAAVGRCLKINRTQRTTTFESLAQICTLWSRHISDSFQLTRNDFHRCAHIGIAVKIRCNNDFGVRALAVESFRQQL